MTLTEAVIIIGVVMLCGITLSMAFFKGAYRLEEPKPDDEEAWP